VILVDPEAGNTEMKNGDGVMLMNPEAGNGVIKENPIKLHSWNNGKKEY
jgi:hypothetical protein